MIKGTGAYNGRPLMLLGLSGENVTRLAAGEPIMFDGADVGYNGTVLIVYGRTEGEIADKLRQLQPPPDTAGSPPQPNR